MKHTGEEISASTVSRALKPAPLPRATLAGAKKIDRVLRDNAVAHDRQQALTDEVVDALHEGGFFGIWVPESMRGAEMKPVESIEIIEQLSSSDASSGWVMFAAALAIGTGAAYHGEDPVAEIYGRDRFPVIAGQGIPNGRAEPTEGGYLLSGAWSYGSGIRHVDYVHTGGIIFENGGPKLDSHGDIQARIFVVPREKFIYGDNWDVIGLRGTGSIDYSMKPTFVPTAFTHSTHTKTTDRGGPLYSIGIIGFASLGHAAFALGVGRRMLDEVALVAQTKASPMGALKDSEAFHLDYARAEAKARAARALVFDVWGDIERTIERGDPTTIRQLTMARLALNHATWSIQEVCAFGYRVGGGIALRYGPIQRLFRDMNAATQHATSSIPILRDCGRELAGLAEGKEWGFIGLVDKH
jgi:alkylation response protein AidB-like acyl-CoA dehydrogenase